MTTAALLTIVLVALGLGTLMVLGFMFEEKLIDFEESLSLKFRRALYKKLFAGEEFRKEMAPPVQHKETKPVVEVSTDFYGDLYEELYAVPHDFVA